MNQPNSEENQCERTIAELHDVVDELAQLGSQREICLRTIDAAEHLLDFDLSIVALEEDGFLQPKAVSSGLSPDEFDAMSIHEGLAGKAYRTGESYLVDDITSLDEAKPQGEWISGISLPIGDHGNFQAVDREVAAFDEQDLQLAELLTMHASNHLDRIQHKQELERQNDRLEEFVGIVSHDLRNPLRVAELRLKLAREESESEHLDGVESAHERMDTLIDELLTLAQEGSAVVDKHPLNLSTIATDSWTNVRTSNATLATVAEQTIIGNESSLKQLFENLFRNAVEHNKGGVTITVGKLPDGFYVEDDGVGIPEDNREDVFEAGYSTSNEGTGFGLRIVKQIVDTHNWQICVTDSSDDSTRFEITGVEFADE